MVKKYLLPLCFLSLIFSLIFNYIQYKEIHEYKKQQSQIDNHVKASINELTQLIGGTDFNKPSSDRIKLITSITERTSTLIKFSSFRNDKYTYDCFLELNLFFSGGNNDKIKENREQIKNLINKVLNKKNSYDTATWEINSNACKELVELFKQIAKSS